MQLYFSFPPGLMYQPAVSLAFIALFSCVNMSLRHQMHPQQAMSWALEIRAPVVTTGWEARWRVRYVVVFTDLKDSIHPCS